MEPVSHDNNDLRAYLLNIEEIADPYLVLDELFDLAHLPELRSLMWEWLKATVTGGFSDEMSSREKNAILCLYEQMQKLLEAAHILHKRTAANRKANMRSSEHPF